MSLSTLAQVPSAFKRGKKKVSVHLGEGWETVGLIATLCKYLVYVNTVGSPDRTSIFKDTLPVPHVTTVRCERNVLTFVTKLVFIVKFKGFVGIYQNMKL